LYTEGEPAESFSEASVALTYGAYDVTDDVACEADADGDALLRSGGFVSEVLSASAEHPAVARAIRQVSPAIGFRKLRISHAPALVRSVSGERMSHTRLRFMRTVLEQQPHRRGGW
jgi:hypothetical protein